MLKKENLMFNKKNKNMDYKVQVELNDETLMALKSGKFQMQAYKGVKTANTGGALPTVWFALDEFSSTLAISWKQLFAGYFSNTPVKMGVTVDISTKKNMEPGNLITLQEDGSASVSTSGGVPDAFAFESKMRNVWTCGLLTPVNGSPGTPICAFPQYGAVGNLMEPYEKVLLLFTQKQLDTGSVVQTAISKSVSIIMSPSEKNITVGFDINTGWDTHGNPQVKQNPASFDLAPDLIVPSASLYNATKQAKLLYQMED
jgi:hypothetical protein